MNKEPRPSGVERRTGLLDLPTSTASTERRPFDMLGTVQTNSIISPNTIASVRTLLHQHRATPGSRHAQPALRFCTYAINHPVRRDNDPVLESLARRGLTGID